MPRCARAARCEPMGPDPYAKHREALRRARAAASRPGRRIVRRTSRIVRRWSALRLPVSKDAPLDAMDLYERAIASARANGFVHNEALAYELAARFYAARGFEDDRERLSAGGSVRLSALGGRRQGAAARAAPSVAEAGRARAGSNGHDRSAGRTARSRDRDRSLASTLRRGSARKAHRQAHACGDQARRR